MIDRHKVFISYYHHDDQTYKNNLINRTIFDYDKCEFVNIFDDYSVRENDIDDTGLNSEQIRRIIRDEYIKDATVLILLCGTNTKHRKHIDWEIHAAMYDSEVNRQMGILVINLPSIKNENYNRSSSEEEKHLFSSSMNWKKLETIADYERCYPYMPARIIDNFIADKPITVIDWDLIENDNEKLMKFIDIAYKRRYDFKYDTSRNLRRNNG